jgi:hypothetical protein
MTKCALAIALALAALAPAAALAKTDARPDLWATVNLCDTPAKPGAVGIRVSIPREKSAPEQWAHIHLQWFDGGKRAWRALRAGGDAGWRRVGIGTRLVQGGTTFSFAAPSAGTRMVLRGVVEVQWRDGASTARNARRPGTMRKRHPKARRSSVLRQRTILTETGMQGVQGGDPAGTSKAMCLIW